MRVLKLFLAILVFSVFSFAPAYAGDINIDKENGIYHIVLKGEKIKKKIKFISIRYYDFNWTINCIFLT